jgi:hypothetical protein
LKKKRRAKHLVPEARLAAGPLVRTALGLTVRSAGPLLVLVALTQGPWAALEAAGALQGIPEADYVRWSSLYGLVLGVLNSGAIVWLVHGAIHGERRGPFACLRRAASRYVSLLGASLQAAIGTLAYLLLLVVPGILKALSYSVVLPVVLLEDRRASAALARSTRLMDGHRLAVALASIVLLPLAAGPFAASQLWPSLDGSALARAASSLATGVLQLPFDVLGVVLYVESVRAHTDLHAEVFANADRS